MGDLANMTDCDGRVNGQRLLRWLRSRAEMARAEERRYASLGAERTSIYHGGRAELLHDMADDLEHELTPPDYPEDDGDEAPPWMSGPHDPHKRSPGADDEEVDLDDPALMGGPEGA